MKKKAFTLTEILTAVIIVAILATLAIPQFIKTMEASKIRLAKTNLKLILAAERVYRNETGFFMPFNEDMSGRVATAEEIIKYLGLDFPDLRKQALGKTPDFVYTINTTGGPRVDFSATAVRSRGGEVVRLEINSEGEITEVRE
ncbi:MAG: type IV pilin protein [Candidatus Omnitrophota bacterium]